MDAPNTIDHANWKRYNREDLPIRTDGVFREDANHIQDTGDKKAADLTGITGLSILAELPSIDFPRSFPPDSMHLFFENVVPALVRHYRGVFLRKENISEEVSTENNGDRAQEQHPTPGGSCKRKRPAVNARPKGKAAVGAARRSTNVETAHETVSRGNQQPQMQKVKFKKTTDTWNIAPKVWERIGRDQKVCYIYICNFGDTGVVAS